MENELGDPFENRKRDEEIPHVRVSDFRLVADSIPALIALMTSDGAVESVNRHALEYFGATLEELKEWAVADTVHPNDLPTVIAAWTRSVTTGEKYDLEHRIRRADGIYRWFHVSGVPLRDAEGHISRWCVLQTDIENRKRAEVLLANEKRLLEAIATGESLPATLTKLCLLVEELCPSCISCSVLLLDDETKKLWHAASPSVPKAYTESIDGFTIGPEVSCCGTAAYHARQVIAFDIATDSRWDDFREPALENGLRACWSTPIFSRQDRVLGTFAMFSGKPSSPTPDDQELIEQITHLASIAIERAKSDEALKRSEARKAAILESALDSILTIDHEGRITKFNPAAERTFGYGRNEVMGKRMADVIAPLSLRERHSQGFARYLATGEARVLGKRFEMTAVRADGTEFPIELAITRATLDGPPSFTGFIRDLTESRLAEEQLRQSDLNLRQMTETIPEMLWSATSEGTIEYCNARVSDYTGFSTEQIQGDGWKDLIHLDDVALAVREWTSCVANGTPYRVEVRTFHIADRMYRWCVTTALPLRDHQGHIVRWHGTIVDMHDWKQAQEELRATQAQLAHMMRVLTMGQLTASIAHEVSQPLAGIITNASTCLRMLAVDPPNVDGARETARRTIRDGNRASDVITKLRALFEKKEIVSEPVDLNDATREVIALSLSDIQRNEVILHTELPDDLPPVLGDRVQLQQVVLNLLLNASDAMNALVDRPRQLTVRTERENDGSVRLTVHDVGVGIEPKNLDQLFNPFYTTKSTGMGIGLSISRSIIESHHGRLWAAANDGPGASFSFSIPSGPDGAPSTINRNTVPTSATTDQSKP